MALAACDCEPSTSCVTATECGAGESCVDEACVAGGRDAAVDSRIMGTECESSAECEGARVCAGGFCVIPDGTCDGDSDCSGDTYCCAEDCAPLGEPSVCVPYGMGPRGDINDQCTGETVPGIFQPDVQCEWTSPPAGDAFPDHVQVLATPLVMNLGNSPGGDPDAIEPGEIIIVTYNFNDGGNQAAVGDDPAYFGVIRILNGQTCEQLETIADPDNAVIGASAPAIGDLDGDGIPEIVAQRAISGLIAFKWNAGTNQHERMWVTTDSDVTGEYRWDGPAIHDLNDDGFPEVISAAEVFDGRTGARLNSGQALPGARADRTGVFSVLADVEGDGAIELVADAVYRWEDSSWSMAYPGFGMASGHQAIADFGTPMDGGFDSDTSDGIAELVIVLAGVVRVVTLQGDVVLEAAIPLGGAGGPPTVGDFDNDGRPEVASAGALSYALFDFDCETPGPECEDRFLRWSATSQDESSNKTGSSIFDFEGDGQAEAVYADECFNRIYDGATGDVLYSAFRTSCTWYENPVIADPDRDENTEILVGSNSNCDVECPELDPIHPGTRCQVAADCLSGMCDSGLCRCTEATECREGNACAAPLPESDGAGNVCRAVHPPGVGQTGLRVLRDSLDRWVSSRPIWNQHAYSITNVNDDGTIPRTSEWAINHQDPTLNNYRQNAQGSRGAGDFPDITGRLSDGVCRSGDGATLLVSTVCNRGRRSVGAALPATFYLGDPSDNVVLCTSFTSGPVPVGGCLEVSCELEREITDETIHVIVNDDGMGGRTTVECNTDNNGDSIAIAECSPLI